MRRALWMQLHLSNNAAAAGELQSSWPYHALCGMVEALLGTRQRLVLHMNIPDHSCRIRCRAMQHMQMQGPVQSVSIGLCL